MSEDKLTVRTGAKPSLWNQALRAVKGDSTNELVEQFTQEMTLVAEGLCEDQARLRKAVDGLIRQGEQSHERANQDYAELSRRVDEQGTEMTRRINDLSKRLDALEKPKPKKGKGALFGGDVIGRVTVLASIICGTWLLVTLLNLLK